MLNKLKLAAVGTLLLAPIGSAQIYYTVDVANDVLCSVNVNTGVVTPMGPLQADLNSVHLAWHTTWAGGALYAKSYGGPGGNRICQIVTDGEWVGFALQGALLNGGGYSVGEAAGLASDGISLYLTYSISNPNDSFSGSFGIVEPIWAGTITTAAPTLPHPHDIDGMCFAGGKFYGVDVIDSAGGYKVYTGTAATGPTSFLGGDTYDVPTNPLDLEAFSGSDLVSVSQNGLNLVFISRTTGKRTLVIPLTGQMPGGILSGIAREPNPCGRTLRLLIQHP